MSYIWTNESVEKLKKMWSNGQSASQIAVSLGEGVTRNAVIGKVHRLGLNGKNKARSIEMLTASKKPRQPGTASPVGVHKAVKVSPPTVSVAYKLQKKHFIAAPPLQKPIKTGPHERVTILHLSDKTCRWPVGHPGNDDFRFCGHVPRNGCVYCEYHLRMAHQPQSEKKSP